MEFNYEEVLKNALEYWTPARIAATVPLDDVFPVYGNTTSDLVLSNLTSNGDGNNALKPSPSKKPKTSSEQASGELSGSSNDASPAGSIGDEDAPTASLSPSRDVEASTSADIIQDFERMSLVEDRLQQQRKVEERELTTVPYESIGKICLRKDGVINPDLHVTAFFIGQPTLINGEVRQQLLTVAHMFDYESFQNAKDLVFITPKYEIYAIDPSEKKIHSSYSSKKEGECVVVLGKFDLCALPVYQIGGTYIDNRKCFINNLTPLVLVADGNINEATFKVIGYPTSAHRFKGEMTEKQGKKLATVKLKNYEHPTIQIDNFSAVGMSGGPWIIKGRDGKLVYGIQSSNTLQCPKPSNATSPYFREELLDPLNLEYIFDQPIVS